MAGGFDSLGLMPELLRAIDDLGWGLPTDVQDEAIPLILGGGDVSLMLTYLAKISPPMSFSRTRSWRQPKLVLAKQLHSAFLLFNVCMKGYENLKMRRLLLENKWTKNTT